MLSSFAKIDWTAGCFGSHDGAIVGDGGGGRRQVVQNIVTCFYVSSLSIKKKEVFITVKWKKNGDEPSSVTVIVDHESSAAAVPFLHARCNSQILRRKGSRSVFSGDSMFLLLWDISAAKYGPGSSSEPTKDFYLIVAVDAELVLLLGDKGKHYVDKFPTAPFSMYSRYEQAVLPTSAAVQYFTKARFRDGGQEHDVTVICRRDRRDYGELFVCVDRERAIHVPNVEWNFRGNQAIAVDDDGPAVVDVLWDVHGWWFLESSGGGSATFLFQARSSPASEQPCWLQEEAPATAAPPPFTLSIKFSEKQ